MNIFKFVYVLALAGCVGSVPPANVDGAVDAATDGKAAPDGAADQAAAAASDLAGVDLAGLVDCYGVAVCDPTMDFCLRYFDGSQGAPGKLSSGPACFTPSDTCTNQGQPMDCNCILNDARLSMGCANCLDHGDGTFDCFAM